MRIFWTGDRGFIAGYAIQQLLKEGHTVIGLDNNWKYGPVSRSFDNEKNYFHYTGDAKDPKIMKDIVSFNRPDVMVNGAAIIGGISMFHELAYDLMAENEKICATFFDTAIEAYKKKYLKKVLAISSSMVYESTTIFPSKEGDERKSAPPLSTYGFQKLAVEYWCQGASEQYGLPYTIIRPFNVIGVGEQRALVDKNVMSGNIKLAMSHVVPDIIQKIIKGQNPLHILGNGNQLRYYTYGGDLAEGVIRTIFSPVAVNQDFNLSTPNGHTVLELAEIIWNRLLPNEKFSYVSDKPFKYDVQKRQPDTSKAKMLIDFEATTSLDKALDEIIPWATEMVKLGKI